MTFQIKHLFVSPKTDGPNSTLVRPSNWNANHSIEFDQPNQVIGRALDTGSGPGEGLPLGIEPDGSIEVQGTGQFTLPVGNEANRPLAPRKGSLRYNIANGTIEIYGLSGNTQWTSIDLGSFMPPGTVSQFAGNSVPVGWFLCNGQAISRSFNQRLFNVIGTIYGVGNGSTTFNVPDLRGKVVIGSDTTYTLGETFGAKTFKLTIPQLPKHKHGIQPAAITNAGVGGTAPGATIGDTVNETEETGNGDDISLLQPSLAMNYIIKG